MNKKIVFILLLATSFTTYAQNEIVGYWLTQEGNSVVEIDKNDDEIYFGKVVWLKEPNDKKGNPHTDRMNRDKSMRSRPIMGMHILENLEYIDGSWNGSIYAAKRGRKLDAELSMKTQDELLVTVSIMGMTRTQIWTRTDLPK